MIPTPAGRVAFWRAWCFALAGVALAEAVALGLSAGGAPPRTPPTRSAAEQTGSVSLPSADRHDAGRSATAEETSTPDAALAHALGTRNRRRHARELEDVGSRLARSDPEAALRALAELGVTADRIAMARGIFDVLAQADAAQALAYAKRTRPGVEREAALGALLGQWTTFDDSSPKRRARYVAEYGLDAGLGFTLLDGDPRRPDLAALWADQLSTGKARVELLGQAAAEQVVSNPSLATSYGQGLTGAERAEFNERLLSTWARTQPEAAWQWSDTLEDPVARLQALGASVAALSVDNPPAATAKLALLPPGAVRDAELVTVAENYAVKDTDAALAWAQTLAPAEGAAANAAINNAVPVGIGARLRVDEQGFPVVQGLVPDAAASQGGQIHAGDRILGVGQGNGQMVDTQQMDLGKVVNLVRGAAGSVVQVQVAAALPNGGFAPPTVVTIVRQRIKPGS